MIVRKVYVLFLVTKSNSVSEVTGYGLDSWGSISGRHSGFSYPAFRPTESTVYEVLGTLPLGKAAGL
jgi:hypothetical protein